MAVKFYNTLTREKEEFKPIHTDWVGIYTCGPTVYNYAHIGNLRSYVFADILQKTLEYNGYNIRRVMNITDIGHLVSDGDDGDDKMTKGLKREGKELTLANMRELAEFYTEKFKEDLIALNLEIPKDLYFASDYVKEDIDLIKKLEEKDFAYKTSDGIYFEVSKFPDYFKLSGRKDNSQNLESRIEINTEKKNPADFALWKFDNKIGFPSPWGTGFPGWHIECSAMSIKFLGEQFDIHTGGVDHIPVHHTNEIAQSEAATGKNPFVKIWMHNEHVDIGGLKMAKSGDNFITLRTLRDKEINNPLAYKFWLLSGHYRTKMNFSWEAIVGAETALNKIIQTYLSWGEDVGKVSILYTERFKEYINNDLGTPQAIALIWELIQDNSISAADKKATLLDFDRVFGFGLDTLKKEIIPEEVMILVNERDLARVQKDWQKSDELRDKIKDLGYDAKDTEGGTKVTKL